MKTVVVTGVSTGIGAGVARVLAGSGARVFGSVRKIADASALSDEFGDRFTPLAFDVTDQAAIAEAAAQVRVALGGARLGGLVNNAGVAISGPLTLQPPDDFRHQIEVNLVGPFLVSQAFAPMLGTDPSLTGTPGRIVNISSVSGKFSAPFLGAYAASKHALEGYSEALRRELMLYGIDVIIVGPGSVATPIWDKAEAAGLGPYAETAFAGPMQKFSDYMLTNGRKGFPPEKIGQVVLTALTAARPKVRYAVVPDALTNWIMPRLLPKRMVDRFLGRTAGLLPSGG